MKTLYDGHILAGSIGMEWWQKPDAVYRRLAEDMSFFILMYAIFQNKDILS